MNIILWDKAEVWENFLPLTYTRPVSLLRVGILTIAEKWAKYLDASYSFLTKDYLQKKFSLKIDQDNLIINSKFLPDPQVIEAIKALEPDTGLMYQDDILAIRVNSFSVEQILDIDKLKLKNYDQDISQINHPYDIFLLNEQQIERDFILITQGRKSEPIDPTNTVFEPERIFVEPGAKITCSILNPDGGYIYIGKDAEIMENSVVHGSFAMCEHSVVKISAKIYGATTLGPYTKVGGELNNVVFIGYSNKAHDGFLGNAVIGEWCNFGADTNNSNLKNNYSITKIWDYKSESFVSTGLQFCGLIMGDHSKTGINTMLNTCTVVGVSANIFGAGFPRKFIPSFSWGGPQGYTEYKLDKALDTARKMMARRHKELTETDEQIMQHVFELTKKYRHF